MKENKEEIKNLIGSFNSDLNVDTQMAEAYRLSNLLQRVFDDPVSRTLGSHARISLEVMRDYLRDKQKPGFYTKK